MWAELIFDNSAWEFGTMAIAKLANYGRMDYVMYEQTKSDDANKDHGVFLSHRVTR